MFEFLIFGFIKISQICLFWAKITIIIIEIYIKLILHTKYNEITLIHTGVACKVSNFIFCHFSQLKNSLYTQTFKYMPRAPFHLKDIFFNAANNVLYQNQ